MTKPGDGGWLIKGGDDSISNRAEKDIEVVG